MSYENWLTLSEAAEALSISREYVRILGLNGILKFVETRFGKLYDPQSVEKARTNRVGQIRKRSGAVV